MSNRVKYRALAGLSEKFQLAKGEVYVLARVTSILRELKVYNIHVAQLGDCP